MPRVLLVSCALVAMRDLLQHILSFLCGHLLLSWLAHTCCCNVKDAELSCEQLTICM